MPPRRRNAIVWATLTLAAAAALAGVTDHEGAIADERFAYGVGDTFEVGGVAVPVVAQVSERLRSDVPRPGPLGTHSIRRHDAA